MPLHWAGPAFSYSDLTSEDTEGRFMDLIKILQLANARHQWQSALFFAPQHSASARVVTSGDPAIRHSPRHHAEVFLTCLEGSLREP